MWLEVVEPFVRVMIGEAMLALGNAELIGVEDTLSLRKIK